MFSDDRRKSDCTKALGISLGLTNSCIKTLVEKGFVKVNNSRNSQNKIDYACFLTPKGFEETARVTVAFLRHKLAEYDTLKFKIDSLQSEALLLEQP